MSRLNRNNLSESDISDKFIRPAMVQAGGHTLEQIYAQFPWVQGVEMEDFRHCAPMHFCGWRSLKAQEAAVTGYASMGKTWSHQDERK